MDSQAHSDGSDVTLLELSNLTDEQRNEFQRALAETPVPTNDPALMAVSELHTYVLYRGDPYAIYVHTA